MTIAARAIVRGVTPFAEFAPEVAEWEAQTAKVLGVAVPQVNIVQADIAEIDNTIEGDTLLPKHTGVHDNLIGVQVNLAYRGETVPFRAGDVLAFTIYKTSPLVAA